MDTRIPRVPAAARALVIVVVALAVSLVTLPPAHAAPKVSVSLGVSWNEFRKGESVVLTGTVKIKGTKAKKGTKVGIVRRDLATGKEGKVATVKTNANGKFSVRLRPANDTVYRARVDGKHLSKSVTVTRTEGSRNLDERARTIGKALGAAMGKASKLSKAERRSLGKAAIDNVRYRNYKGGLLVEVTTDGLAKTWLVSGKIRTAYLKADGPEGKYGVPVADAKCGLLETGCIQRFTNGALYQKASKSKAVGQTGKSKATELVATARSQLGYMEPGWRKSKYNKWVKSVGQPWCSAFQSWVSAASGNGGLIPKHKRLAGLLKDVKRDMTVYKNSSKEYSPKMGHLAFYNFRPGAGSAPTHVGLVLKATKTTVTTLEGNASASGNFGSKRGIFIHERPRSRVAYFAIPNY